MQSLLKYGLSADILVAGHRGASGLAPENTLESFQKAIELGIDIIEIDVQITADSKIIVLHDEFIEFEKQNVRISDLDLATLESKLSTPEKTKKIPLLADVLKFLKGKSYVILEIKNETDSFDDDGIRKLIEILRQHDYQKYALLASFDYGLLNKINVIDNSLYLAVIKIPGDQTLPSQLKKTLDFRALICSVHELTEELVNDAAVNHLFLGVYSVDSEKEFELAMSFGVKAIGSDYPGKIKRMLEAKKMLDK